MGLFGSLFSKEPQEVKNFWKAFNTMYGKFSQKNFSGLEEAAKACPNIWQGPFLLGLALDLPNEIPSDAEKAKNYHYQAEQLAKKTANAEWVESFYYWYRTPALNYIRKVPYTEQEMALRRLGVAALNNYENMKAVVTAHDEKDDAKFWSKVFWSACGYTDEYKPFADVFGAWKSYRGGRASHDALETVTKDLIKVTNKNIEQYNKIIKQLNNGKEVDKYAWAKYRDMYTYVLAKCLCGDSPYILDEWGAAEQAGGEVPMGINRYAMAADGGNGAAAHQLTYLVFSKDANISKLARNAMAAAGFELSDLRFWLSSCADLGDNEAGRLLDTYFSEA